MLRAGRGCRAQGEGTAGQPNLPCLWVITFILTPVRLNWLSADLILLYRLGLKKRCGDPRFWLPWTPSLPRPPARLDCASAVCLPASDPRRWPLDVHADSIFQEENEALVSPASSPAPSPREPIPAGDPEFRSTPRSNCVPRCVLWRRSWALRRRPSRSTHAVRSTLVGHLRVGVGKDAGVILLAVNPAVHSCGGSLTTGQAAPRHSHAAFAAARVGER